jgi:hypothetical protein
MLSAFEIIIIKFHLQRKKAEMEKNRYGAENLIENFLLD